MNLIVCGRRLEGKSTLSLKLARESHRGIVIFDPRGMFAGFRCADAGDVDDAIREREWEKQPIILTPAGDPMDCFSDLCDVLFPPQFTLSDFGLVIDEAGMLQSSHSSHPALARAVAQHPHRGITIIQNTHRLPEIHGKSKALMDDLYIFKTTHPGDLATLLDFVEGDAEVIERVQALPPHHCIHYTYRREAGAQWNLLDKPELWYAPIQEGRAYAEET